MLFDLNYEEKLSISTRSNTRNISNRKTAVPVRFRDKNTQNSERHSTVKGKQKDPTQQNDKSLRKEASKEMIKGQSQ